MNLEVFTTEMSKIGYYLTKKQHEQFELYYSLLIEWNEKINLTSIVEKEEVYLKHFYDSATIAKTLKIEDHLDICDVGTGAGFPGIVIKILFPESKITLLDSLLKRIKFLDIVIEKLELNKITTIHERVEDFASKNREVYDCTIARAVAPLNILLEYCIPITKINGYFVAMKSNISQEINNSNRAMKKLNCFVEKIDEFFLPIENSARSIILIKKTKKTDKNFPRKPNIIKKNPL